ncbi:translation initiation factor eIF-2B [Haloarcula onubensis]|uniref:Translation initiation factor eIF-2B n=1 Tax=Haloarcula onubensis TaxID=2950539 RepID=A0ABU2FPU6_9EURY|nr:translation initiation factor eIF-2B [Halomicroarcula sp. S3CR25-11]MDS0282779.1 translation initiation factor eIF-2B [Halomicroarcula sp. S3CR25-11]
MIDETVREIEEMQTQSSSIVAVKAAQALRELTERECHTVEDFNRVVERNSSALQRANRSHAPLYTTQQRIVEAVTESDADSVEEAKDVLVEAIEDVVEEVESSKQRAAERAAELVDDGDTILTHENSSTVMATVDEILAAGKEIDAYVTESRPRFLGRKTARQLAERDGVAATLITDGAAGHYLAEVDRVVIGMNCLIEDVVYNRIGTHSVAATANSHDVPVTVVGSSSKFIGGGFTFENTFRPASEVMLEPAEGFDVANPGYDATPTRLIDSVVTENAVMEF